MKNKSVLTIGCFFFFACIALCRSKCFAQDKDDGILVQGKPPLTQLMVGKAIVLLDWILDLKLNKDQENQIGNIIQNAWKQNNTGQIKSTLEVINIYEQIMKLSETERNAVKAQLQPVFIQNLQKESKDDLTALVHSLYQSSLSTSSLFPDNKPSDKPTTPNSTSTITKNSVRVGADGFTGLYRMVRPKPLDINRTTYEPGYTVEHLTFFPDGKLYKSLPPEGLLYFDFSVACKADPRDCGWYEIKNDEIHIYLGPEKTKHVLSRNGERINNALELGKASFRLIPACDGLKLEGRYRRHESEQAIAFTKDGNFTDEGAFKNFGTIGRLDGTTFMDDGIGGSGTYLIEQNTLELKYSDGRIKRFPFVAFPENLVDTPAVKQFLLYEQRLERY